MPVRTRTYACRDTSLCRQGHVVVAIGTLQAITQDDAEGLVVLAEIRMEPVKTATVLQAYHVVTSFKRSACGDAYVETPETVVAVEYSDLFAIKEIIYCGFASEKAAGKIRASLYNDFLVVFEVKLVRNHDRCLKIRHVYNLVEGAEVNRRSVESLQGKINFWNKVEAFVKLQVVCETSLSSNF